MIVGFGSKVNTEAYDLLKEERLTLGQDPGTGFISYEHLTEGGYSGTPLLLKTNEDTFEMIGIHKGYMPHKNFGLSFRHL